MIAIKCVVIIFAVMMSALNLSPVLANPVTPQGPATNAAVVGPQSGQTQSTVETSQPVHPQTEGNPSGWPNYAYPPYHNPYYYGGTGNLLSGAIDWVLEFPSSAWDRFSEFLDRRLFPNSPATYGGKPNTSPIPPQNAVPQNGELPKANPYKSDGK